jgi:acylphosphatase
MTSEPARSSVHVVISGRVQGVWFRGWIIEEARVHGLDGWVRNRDDGNVEALFSGPAQAVEAMVQACWRGPPAARVADVQVTPAAPPEVRGFRKLPTF